VTLSECVSNCTIVTRTTHILGLHPQNIIAAISKHQLINTYTNHEWATKSKSQQSDVTSVATKTTMESWWRDETKVSPNHKDVCSSQVSKWCTCNMRNIIYLKIKYVHEICFQFLFLIYFISNDLFYSCKVCFQGCLLYFFSVKS
jgi:sensor c-di-GMP phosphodiesterase-like protein